MTAGIRPRPSGQFDRLGSSVFIRCKLCEEVYIITFRLDQQLAFEASCMNGVDRRQALAFAAPNMPTNDRDLIASGHCTSCLDDMTDVTPMIIDLEPNHDLEPGEPHDDDPEPDCACANVSGRWDEDETWDARDCPLHGPDSEMARRHRAEDAAEEAAFWWGKEPF